MEFNLDRLTRPNIKALKPYSCARTEFKGEASIHLDANENPNETGINRYPDPFQTEVKEKIAAIKGVRKECIMLGNGSDEPIDLIYRIFCEPGKDNVVAIAPTYGMYQVCADINNVEYKTSLLSDDFQFSAKKMLEICDENTKVAWICSPNNPTGNHLCRNEIEIMLRSFNGIVVVDEAYIDFFDGDSFSKMLNSYKNLIVLQTFSKAWGCAAIRLGMAFASEEIINLFNKVKYPYNINILTQKKALEILDNTELVKNCVKEIKESREELKECLLKLKYVKKVYPSDANFLLVKVDDACFIYDFLVKKGIILRNRHNVSLCDNCLRITVGTKKENEDLLKAMHEIQQ